jgi:hypothetical protein
MDKYGKLGRNTALALAATILTTALVGCGSNLPSPGENAGKASNTGRSVTPTQQREVAPTTPKSDYGDDVPTNIPQPIPQPEQPSEPGKIGVKVVANTVTSNPLAAFTSAAPNRISVYSTISWSKTEGASQYRVSRREEGASDEKFYIRANVPASFRGYQDGGIMSLKIGIKYDYRVEALDSTGNVIAAGEDSATPLYPVGMPAKDSLKPADGTDGLAGSTPDFSWGEVKDAQGYYVEVFSSVTMLPMWRGYRDNTHGTAITYGDQVDILAGTFPAVWTQPLNPAGTYTWSLTAIKTDTGNAVTAKAWAKSNTPAMRFYMGKKALGGK